MGASAEFRAAARKVATLPERIVRAGAAELNASILRELDQDTGGDRILSGTVGRRGRRIKLGTTTRVTGGRSIATATITASPRRGRAPWSWLESGTAVRRVGELRLKRTGPGGKHLHIGGHWITGPVDAGRSPAKHTWTEGVRHGIAAAERAMAAELDKGLR